jgi:hypothetical protein
LVKKRHLKDDDHHEGDKVSTKEDELHFPELNELLIEKPDRFFDDNATPRLLRQDSYSKRMAKKQSSRFLLSLENDLKSQRGKNVRQLEVGGLAQLRGEDYDTPKKDVLKRLRSKRDIARSEAHCETERVKIVKPDWTKQLLAGQKEGQKRKDSSESPPFTSNLPSSSVSQSRVEQVPPLKIPVKETSTVKEVVGKSETKMEPSLAAPLYVDTPRMSFGVQTPRKNNTQMGIPPASKQKNGGLGLKSETGVKGQNPFDRKRSEGLPSFAPVGSAKSSVKGGLPQVVISERVSYAEVKTAEDLRSPQGCTGKVKHCTLI